MESICQLNTVGVTIGLPSIVINSAPSGYESTVTSTLGSELFVSIVVDVNDVVVALVVFCGEFIQACNGWLAAVGCDAVAYAGVLKPGLVEESETIIMSTGNAMDARNFKLNS